MSVAVLDGNSFLRVVDSAVQQCSNRVPVAVVVVALLYPILLDHTNPMVSTKSELLDNNSLCLPHLALPSNCHWQNPQKYMKRDQHHGQPKTCRDKADAG